MPATLDGDNITAAQKLLLKQGVEQAVVDRLGRSLTDNEAKDVDVFLTWVETWKRTPQ